MLKNNFFACAVLLSGCAQPADRYAFKGVTWFHEDKSDFVEPYLFNESDFIDQQENTNLFISVQADDRSREIRMTVYVHGHSTASYFKEGSRLRLLLISHKGVKTEIALMAEVFHDSELEDCILYYGGPACVFHLTYDQFKEIGKSQAVTYTLETSKGNRVGKIPDAQLQSYARFLLRIQNDVTWRRLCDPMTHQ